MHYVEKWRKPLKALGEDPFGDKPGEEVGKKKLAEVLASGDPEAASLVQSAIEDFAQQLAFVIRRFLRLKDWRDTQCISVGGGFRASRVGELAVARAGLLLRAEDIDLDLELIRNDPDEAGLLGAAHLLPAWMLKGHDGILAVDIGGTHARFAIAEVEDGRVVALGEECTLKTAEHASLQTAWEDFGARLGRPLPSGRAARTTCARCRPAPSWPGCWRPG